jgi:hypothetical protein
VIRLLFATVFAWQLAFVVVVAAMAAEPPAAVPVAAAAPAHDVFSGTVTALGNGTVTVVRKVPARADEARTFVVDTETKIEGKPKVAARVAVRFRTHADGTVHALRIIVRSEVKSTTSAAKPVPPRR